MRDSRVQIQVRSEAWLLVELGGAILRLRDAKLVGDPPGAARVLVLMLNAF